MQDKHCVELNVRVLKDTNAVGSTYVSLNGLRVS